MAVKDKILDLLRDQGGYISGEDISRSLGVSRTAVWKHVHSLLEEGYDIEARRPLGYRLRGIPDLLLPREIRRDLEARVLGGNILHFHRLGSTNQVARELARKGAPEGTVVVAEEQTAGKGRWGRNWHSPPRSSISLSLILRPRLAPTDTPQVTLLAAVAVAGALRSACGLEAGIKWPNDVLVGGRKVCGILTELEAEMEEVRFLVLGIGVNVNQAEEDFPPEIRGRATSLRLESGRAVNRVAVARSLLAELDRWYLVYLREGFGPVAAGWKGFNLTLGHRITVSSPQRVLEGTARDLAEDGGLLVELEDGRIARVLAGEVL